MASFLSQIGTTPPGTPTTQAAFRTNKAAIMNFIQQQVAANPQPIPTPITRKTIVAPTAPRVGGVEQVGGYYTCWTGGQLDEFNVNEQTQPASSYAYRSSDLSQILKIEKVCTAGLPESRRLPVPGPMDSKDASSAVTIVTWLREITQAVIDRGLDPVFRATIGTTQVFLLEKWGSATKANVDAHVAWLRTNGDSFDKQNLQLSAKFIKNSLDDELLRRVEQELGNQNNHSPTGPDVFAAVISLHTVINHSTQRLYISQLQKLKLIKEPGEDVTAFSDKVLSIARHIGGLSETPIPDLHTLIYQCYEGASTPTFASTVTNLLADCFKSVTTANDWESNVAYLKQLHRDLVNRSCWVALKTMKEKSDGTAAKGSVKSLKAELKRLKKVGNGHTRTSDKSSLICYWCGEAGHAKPNCPNLDQPKKYKGETKTSGSASSNTSNNAKQPPKDGEPHTKSINGSVHKWCGTCKHWNSGAKAHHTAEHVVRPQATATATAPTAVVATAAANVAASSTPSLSFVSGYIGTTTLDTVEYVDSEEYDEYDFLGNDLRALEEEERERERWLVIEDGTKHCLVCGVPVFDEDEHEQTNEHFQRMLLLNFGEWFDEKTKAEAEEAEAKSAVEREEEWTLVEKKVKAKYKHTKPKSKSKKPSDVPLKAMAGQL